MILVTLSVDCNTSTSSESVTVIVLDVKLLSRGLLDPFNPHLALPQSRQ